MTKNYIELYRRNWPLIPEDVQVALGNLRVGVAGCGSTGGAVIEGLLRAGVQNFHLTDNGEYELNNLNRQFVDLNDIGVNKASAHANRIRRVNSEAVVQCWDDGLTEVNLADFVAGCDFVFDAVDVTTEAGIKMKLRLHEVLFEKKIPTGSALDLGFLQWLQSYNYHKGETLLKGRLEAARSARAPLKALILGFSPVEDLPLEITEELIRLLQNPKESASQLACACYALAAMMTPYMIYFIERGELPPLAQLDLLKYFRIQRFDKDREKRTADAHNRLVQLIERTP